MSVGYAWEKLYLAVEHLATGPGTIKERLRLAYVDQVSRLCSGIVEVPEQIRPALAEIRRELTKVDPTSTEGVVVASLLRMSTEEACALARRIVELYDVVAELGAVDWCRKNCPGRGQLFDGRTPAN